jgi:hypothetical protein
LSDDRWAEKERGYIMVEDYEYWTKSCLPPDVFVRAIQLEFGVACDPALVRTEWLRAVPTGEAGEVRYHGAAPHSRGAFPAKTVPKPEYSDRL